MTARGKQPLTPPPQLFSLRAATAAYCAAAHRACCFDAYCCCALYSLRGTDARVCGCVLVPLMTAGTSGSWRSIAQPIRNLVAAATARPRPVPNARECSASAAASERCRCVSSAYIFHGHEGPFIGRQLASLMRKIAVGAKDFISLLFPRNAIHKRINLLTAE